MKHRSAILPLLLAAALVAAPAMAEMFIYPAKGQSEAQQKTDKSECSTWATQQTGYNPAAPPTASAPPPPPPPPTGGLLRGGARGAAIGAVGGAIGGDAGKGAAIGAATGAMMGGIRRRESIRDYEYEQQQHANQQAAQIKQKQASYEQAYSTCLTGRGYTVSGS